MSANNTTDICDVSDNIIDWMWRVIAPVIIFVGLLGNFIVVMVFRRLHFTRSSTLLHLFVLAINDSVVLCIGPVRYWTLHTLNYDLRTTSEFGCKLNYFVVYVSVDFSAWILVSITVERVFSVVRPLHVRRWFTVRRATLRISIIFLLLSGLNMHFFFTNGLIQEEGFGVIRGTGEMVCDSLTDSYKYFEDYVFVWVDACFSSLIPFAIMAFSNWYIVTSLRKSIKNQPRHASGREANRNDMVDDLESDESVNKMSVRQQDAGVLGAVNSVESRPAITMTVCDLSEIRAEMQLVPLDVASLSTASHLQPPFETLHGSPHLLPRSTAECSQPPSPCSLSGSPSALCINPGRNRSYVKRGDGKYQSMSSSGVTRTLLLVTSVFLITTLPSSVYLIVDTFVYDKDSECTRTNAIMDIAWSVSTLLMYTNYGANILLYSARSHRFRQELRCMFRLSAARPRLHNPSSVLDSTVKRYTMATKRRNTLHGRNEFSRKPKVIRMANGAPTSRVDMASATDIRKSVAAHVTFDLTEGRSGNCNISKNRHAASDMTAKSSTSTGDRTNLIGSVSPVDIFAESTNAVNVDWAMGGHYNDRLDMLSEEHNGLCKSIQKELECTFDKAEDKLWNKNINVEKDLCDVNISSGAYTKDCYYVHHSKNVTFAETPVREKNYVCVTV